MSKAALAHLPLGDNIGSVISIAISGELPECDHLDFWLGTLRTAKMMSEVNDAPPPGADDVLAMAEGLTRMMQISQELNPAPEPSWLSGALLVC